MARLPDRTTLGERDPRSVRGVPSYPMDSPVAAAAGEMGRAIAGVGSDIMNFAAERQQTNDKLELARARSGFNAEAIRLRTELKDDQEYQTLAPRVEQRLGRSREDWAGRIRDPRIREQFMLESADDFERNRSWAVERSSGLERDRGLASFQERATEGQRLFFEAQDDEERGRLISGYGAEVNAMVEKGWISATDGQRLKEDWQRGAALTYIESLPAAQRAAIVQAGDGAEAALIQRESSGNPAAVNQFGFAGLYQFGAPRLETIGVYTKGAGEDLSGWNKSGRNASGKWSGTFSIPGFEEVRTLDDFLANPAAQRAAHKIHVERMDSEAAAMGLDKFIGQDVGGVTITRAGLRNMMHLGGAGGARRFLESGGTDNVADANGTSLGDYARMGNADGAQYVRYLTPAQQMAVGEGALRELAAAESATQRQALANSAALGERFERIIIDANAGRAPLPARSVIENDPGLTEGKRNDLLRSYDSADADGRLARAALGRLSSGDSFFDPTSADDRNGLDALFRMDNGTDRLRQGEAGFVDAAIVPLIERAGIIPKSAVSTLMQMARAGDESQAMFALASMERLQRVNPQVFARDFDGAAVDMVNDYRAKAQFATPAQIIEEMRRADDPATREARKELREEGRRLAAEIDDDDITDFFAPGLFSWSPELPPSALMTGAMRNEFRTLYADAYARTGDADRAKTESMEKLGTVWGATTIATDGTRRVMRRPPEKIYPTIDNSHDWMRAQLEADAAPFLQEGDAFAFIVSDPRTEAEMGSNPRPSYALMIRDQSGAVRPVMDEAGTIARVRFDPQSALAEGRASFEETRAAREAARAARAETPRGRRIERMNEQSRIAREAREAEQVEDQAIPPEARRDADNLRMEGFNRGRDALMNMDRERAETPPAHDPVADPVAPTRLPENDPVARRRRARENL
jgi:hypothetical protein